MLAYELEKLLSKKMKEKGYGGREITVIHSSAPIVDVEFCTGCNQFHIILGEHSTECNGYQKAE